MRIRQLRAWLVRLMGVFRKEARDRELAEELESHLQMHIEDGVRAGLSPREARRLALIKLGGVEQTKETCRRQRGVPLLEDLWQDLRYGARGMLRQRTFTLVAVLTLALGIGANTALFSVVDALLLKTLPVKEPERLVLFQSMSSREFSPGFYSGNWDSDPATGQNVLTSFPYQSYRRMREQTGEEGVLSNVFAFGDVTLNVSADGEADVARGQAVSGNYYAALGVQALRGRALADGDDWAGAEPAAVLSYRYWQRRFGGDPGVIGKQITLNRVGFTVVGVMPPGFEGTGQVGSTQDVTFPLAWEPRLYADPVSSRMNGAGEWWLRMMGRLKPGATTEQARAQLESAFQQSVIEHRAARQTQARATGGHPIMELGPKDYPRLHLAPGGQGEMDTRQSYAPSLYLLLGVVGLVLLIACANVANLLLGRAVVRQKEIGVRLALGASRRRLLRQLVTESLLLAFLGGALGVVFALWIKNSLLAVSDWGGRGLAALEPQLDWRVLAFTLALSLLTGMVFGLAPAWRATKVDLTPALKDSGRISSAMSRSLLSRGLVVLQVALSALLLVGAGLFVRTLVNLHRVELGFNTRNLLLFDVRPELVGYKDERRAQLYQHLSERLETVPGVREVTFSRVPLLGRVQTTRSVYLRGALTAAPDAEGRIKANGQSNIHYVRENFLEVMEIPLLAGRPLNAHDDARAPKVIVVNRAFADRYFPGENPIGQRLTFDPKKPDEIEVVGLAQDAKYKRQRDEIPPTAYLSWRQGLGEMNEATVELRTAGDPAAVITAVRKAVREVDGNLALNNIRPQVEQADQALALERLFARLMTLFGLLAQLLAAVGLFGVLAHTVAQRIREIGIRMALGADRLDVLKMILRQGMTLALLGGALGLFAAYGLTKYLESRLGLSQMLYGVKSFDPLTYGATAALLMLVTLAACFIPARRATKVDPLVALRYE